MKMTIIVNLLEKRGKFLRALTGRSGQHNLNTPDTPSILTWRTQQLAYTNFRQFNIGLMDLT